MYRSSVLAQLVPVTPLQLALPARDDAIRRAMFAILRVGQMKCCISKILRLGIARRARWSHEFTEKDGE